MEYKGGIKVIKLLYTFTCLSVTAFFAVLVWYLITIKAVAVAVVAAAIWFTFIVIFLTLAEKEKRGGDLYA